VSPRRVAVVHDWLIDYAGAERVAAEILRCFPQADLFTLVDHMPEGERAPFAGRPAHTTFLQRMPGVARHLKYYLPLMPFAIEQLDVTGYDLVISSSSAVAKGVIVSPDALHVCYLHSPMRYAYDLKFTYLAGERGLGAAALRLLLHRLRRWDHSSSAGVDHFVAASRFVARRLRKAYRREASVVIPPPVDTAQFRPGSAPREDYYVTVARLMPFKRVDLLVQAFASLPDRRLVVVGDGPEMGRLKASCPPNVELAGRQAPEQVCDYLQRARAFVFASVDDFGIAPVEALACGTPVIALRKGGAAETVSDLDSARPTGVFFDEQSAPAIVAAVRAFEAGQARILPEACRQSALEYSAERFGAQLRAFVDGAYEAWRRGLSA
jgi:glycosyltransferase involved in cell wall biosynthesis